MSYEEEDLEELSGNSYEEAMAKEYEEAYGESAYVREGNEDE